ncbi:MAG: hypothetical protein HYX75_13015 [Acidobacteria bacterium]|nr:hypothetical protein [Acidobacteriota bacterium]
MQIDELERSARLKCRIGVAFLALAGYLLWNLLPSLRLGQAKGRVTLFWLFDVPQEWLWVGSLAAVFVGFSVLHTARSDRKILAASKRRVRDRQLDEEHRSRGA